MHTLCTLLNPNFLRLLERHVQSTSYHSITTFIFFHMLPARVSLPEYSILPPTQYPLQFSSYQLVLNISQLLYTLFFLFSVFLYMIIKFFFVDTFCHSLIFGTKKSVGYFYPTDNSLKLFKNQLLSGTKLVQDQLFYPFQSASNPHKHWDFTYPVISSSGLRRNDYLFHSVVFRMASYASISEFHICPSR